MNNKQKLYVIGGIPRCGKTTIINHLLSKTPVQAISSDDIRAGLRRLHKQEYVNATAEEIEDNLTWEATAGIIMRHDYQNISLAIEGIVLTPERISSLNLENLELHAVFVGFLTESFIQKIITNGVEYKDWIGERIAQGSEARVEVQQMLESLREKSHKLKIRTTEVGYLFQAADDYEFQEHVDRTVGLLLCSPG